MTRRSERIHQFRGPLWQRLALMAVVVAGCAAQGTSGIAASGTGTITVPAGREFVISRDANPTTGYQWRLGTPPDAQVVTLVRDEYQPAPDPRPGAPGVQVWTFKAVGAGTTTLVFEYARPWETGVEPARRDTVTVRGEGQ